MEDFYKYVEDSEPNVAVTRIAKDGFEVIMYGFYGLEVLEEVVAKMKELQEAK